MFFKLRSSQLEKNDKRKQRYVELNFIIEPYECAFNDFISSASVSMWGDLAHSFAASQVPYEN